MTSTADTDTVPTLHFCSDHFAEHERLTVWRELLGHKVLGMEAKPLPDRPFHFDRTVHDLPGLSMVPGRGSGAQYYRPKSMIESDDLSFVIGSCIWCMSQFGREAALGPGDAILASHGAVYSSATVAWNGVSLRVPAAAIAPLVPTFTPRRARPSWPRRRRASVAGPLLGLVRNGPSLATSTPRLFATHVRSVAMAPRCHAGREGIAGGRGVRAARLHTIVEEIRQHFADPQFSPSAVAGRLRVSPRYVQDLLQETGLPFTDRVIALRLEKARTMLEAPPTSTARSSTSPFPAGSTTCPISTAASRRRFGASPAQFRGLRLAVAWF